LKEQRTYGKSYIPSYDEIENWYEEEIRIDGYEELESNIKGETDESFFNSFRRLERKENKKEDNFKRENIYYKDYKKFWEEEIEYKGKEIEEIENLISYHEFFLKWERRNIRKKHNSNNYTSNAGTRYRVDAIRDFKNQLERLVKESKEAWQFYYRRQLIDDIQTKGNQRLIKVPYVEDSKKKVIDSLDLGIPVYIVGHLGSGKTQLAIEAATDFTIENKVQDRLEEGLENWFKENPNAKEEDAIKKFKELNKEIRQYYSDIFISGTKEEVENLQPLFISGSHNLTYEDMFVEKTLSLKQSFSNGSFSDYLNMIIDDFYIWMDKHEEKLGEMTEEEELQLKIQIWKSFSDLLVASNSAFGTEIRKIEKEILKAVQEGRPVIIDELNTVAMQNLIGLNDILQRRAGSTAYITGVGPVLIKPGFGFIGTGNLSSESVNYEGTNQLNPAFKSRFVTVEYNYLPQNITGSLKSQENMESNQLFRIILTELANKDGSIHIPNPKRSLEELFRFAQLSRVTQNVFMGKGGENLEVGSVNDELELRESVLSIRNILHVLDSWNLGEEKDLSKALWDGFISSITYADDQNFILSQAVRFGFFPEDEGWNVRTKAIGEGITTYEEIRTRPYNYIRHEIGILSYLDIAYLISPRGPKKRKISKELDNLVDDIKNSQNIGLEEFQELEEQLSHLEHTKILLEYLEEKSIDL